MGLALAEYWLLPLLFNLTNFAGVWSDLGVLLFLLAASTVTVFVLFPLVSRLAALPLRYRIAFTATWSVSFLLLLFATNAFAINPPATSGPAPGPSMEVGPYFTPFGMFPSFTFIVLGGQLVGTLTPPTVFLLGGLTAIWAGTLVLILRRRGEPCAVPAARSENPRGWSSASVLAPLGFVTGCPGCAPMYLAALGLVAPGATAGGLSMVPLAPWIGFAGLLYLVSFVLAVYFLNRTTRSTSASAFAESAAGETP